MINSYEICYMSSKDKQWHVANATEKDCQSAFRKVCRTYNVSKRAGFKYNVIKTDLIARS